MQLRRSSRWRPLAVVGALSVLSVGIALYTTGWFAGSAAAEESPDSVIPGLDTSADAAGPVLEGASDPPDSGPEPAEMAPEPAAPVAKPAAKPAAKRELPVGVVAGQVVATTAEPAAFTVQSQNGGEVTYRVAETTVFRAGYDRPYNFARLKVGDGVTVRGGMPGARSGAGQAAAGQPKPGQAKPGRAQQERQAAGDGAQPEARLVTVRPAGEQARRSPGR